ncbi:TPA: RNA methyltransferase [Candidatus Woesearchaeota archaeon]|nr:RNA methyltransferase [Candidatus Woesearchaeota archaeon]
MLAVVLVEPETPGNIGSVARVMKNFGVKRLLLVNPKCNHLDGEAYGRAMHARDILKAAVVVKNFGCLEKFDYIIGTTASLGSDYNVLRSPITPGQLAQQLSQRFGGDKSRTGIALVFGREGNGLTNGEVSGCDMVVTIPSAMEYPALNLSHAVAILLYELFKGSASIRSHIGLASRTDKEVALSMAGEILSKLEFPVKGKRKTHSVVLSRMVNKSFLTKREIFALIGFLRKVLRMIGK